MYTLASFKQQQELAADNAMFIVCMCVIEFLQENEWLLVCSEVMFVVFILLASIAVQVP